MREQLFARLLIIILPATLVLTWISKLLASDSLRRDALGELYAASERAADVEERSQRTIIQYVSTAVADPPSCSPDERRLLFRIGAQLSGDRAASSLALRYGWGEAADCCQWEGVGCDDGGRVRSLSLAKHGLEGTLATELGGLARLASLDLNENERLSGTLPSELFGSGGHLTHLYAFGARRLSGTLPAALCGARALQEIELSSCRLSGTLPAGLGAYGGAGAAAAAAAAARGSSSGGSSLRYVFLESNRISGVVPPSLGKLRGLRELELSQNRLSGSVPRAVVRLHLDHLDLADNAPSLKGVPTSAPKQGCSGGSAKYLRAGGGAADRARHEQPAAIVATGRPAAAAAEAPRPTAAISSVGHGRRRGEVPREQQSTPWLSPPPPP